MPETPLRHVRVSDELVDAAAATATKLGSDGSAEFAILARAGLILIANERVPWPDLAWAIDTARLKSGWAAREGNH
jgi:hypothetical protein